MPVPTLTTLTAHTQAKAADVMADLNALLAVIDPDSGPTGGVDGDNMKRGTAGQLWIADAATGAFIRKSVSGDIDLAASGAATIKDGAVISRKLKPVIGETDQTGGPMAITNFAQDIPGTTVTITPSVASKLMVAMSFDISMFDSHNLNAKMIGYLVVDGVAQPKTAKLEGTFAANPTPNASVLTATIARTQVIALDASAHVLKLGANRILSNQDMTVDFAQLAYFLTAA